MKKIITLLLLIAFITSCSMNDSDQMNVSDKSDITTVGDITEDNQKEETEAKDINNSMQTPIQKYSIDDVKRAFEGLNNGFIYYLCMLI